MVEAMASGLPSVAADTPVNREVFGDAALYFDAFDPEACARAMGSCLGDETQAAELSRAGKERSLTFSWSEHAENLRAVLESIAAPGS